ncbi:hypothetical protein E1293_26305 [Actinomadura darangshiensis]|uniref:Uncharacterized protein n=1 Tax=Actinomadura darangshiensis TaxID=705336 RepID=A0A4R5AVG3_9ACTN|nr:hypothetical protein [Actinomadura darangshiensis]TDD76773.1 hypothetical protein E1293_26305 [Actinomadura darangshiensis]
MNLNDRRRKLLFAGLVVVLAAVGIYLTVASPSHESDDGPQARSSATATNAPGPSSTPSGIQSAVNPGDFDIYRLLPFSRQEFATAADMAQRFVAAYGTYRYDETPQAYMGRFTGLATDDLQQRLGQDAATPGIVDQRKREQTVAQGSASLDRVRNIEDNSIIFLVTGSQQLTKGGTKTSDTKKYAVTVSRDGGSLKVYSFEPADAGQAGDTG